MSAGQRDPAIGSSLRLAPGGIGTWRVYGKSRTATATVQFSPRGGTTGDARRHGRPGSGRQLRQRRHDRAFLATCCTAATTCRIAHQASSATVLPGHYACRFLRLRHARVERPVLLPPRIRRVPQQLTHHIDVFDLDAQHIVALGSRNNAVWGGGAGFNWDKTPAATPSVQPGRHGYPLLTCSPRRVALVPDASV